MGFLYLMALAFMTDLQAAATPSQNRERSVVSHGREGRFDRVGGAHANPVLRREVGARQQPITIHGEFLRRLRVCCPVGVHKGINGTVCIGTGRRLQLSCSPAVMFVCTGLR